MARTPSTEHTSIGPRQVRSFANFDANEFNRLHQIGINISPSDVMDMMEGFGMDALTPMQTTPSIVTPLQFLQTWLPGFVRQVTSARKIDELVGISTVGSWEDEEIVQGYMELIGTPVPYGDYTNIPFSSYNVNFQGRTIVRFEEGMRVGKLEEARSARANVTAAAVKREACSNGLEIQRNSIGFFGFNNGSNLTYGFLNEANLPAFSVLPNGATNGSPSWASKTFQDIQRDLRAIVSGLRVSSNEAIDPDALDITIAVATISRDYLSVTTDFGMSVADWLKRTYPKVRVVSAPELNAAHGGSNVLYVYAEKLNDTGTDDGKTFMQAVPVKFKMIGVEQRAKGYLEDYGNATAGIFCKRPFAVARYYGC